MTQDLDQKRLLLAIAICAVILGLWSWLFPQPAVQPPPPASAPDAGVAGESAPPPRPGEPAPAGPTEPVFEIKTVATLRAPGHQAIELGNDAGIRAWILEEEQYQESGPDGEKRPVRFAAPIGEVPSTGIFLPPRLDLDLGGEVARGEYRLVGQDDLSATFERVDGRSGVRVTRLFRLLPETNQLAETVRLENTGTGSVPYDLTAVLRGAQNDREASGSIFSPPLYLFEAVCEHGGGFEREQAPSIAEDLRDPDEPTQFTKGVRWGGVDNRYFMTAVSAASGEVESCDFDVGAKAAGVAPNAVPPGFSFLVNRVGFTGGTLEPGQSVERTVTFYGGPKKLSVLRAVEPPLSEAIDFGMFAIICVPMLWLMRVFHGVFANWGVAIILLTVVVKLLTLPLTHKQYKSMAAMKKLQPELKALQEKHKDDRLKLQQKMMELYKQNKVNPLAGCLPALMMMPIYFALYRTIYSAVELYQADFALWITDLAAKDPYFVTPLLLGVVMWLQMKLSPTTGDALQQKMMMYIMPVMFTGMMLFLPSGLVLYIFVNTLLGIAQQYWLLKQAEPQKA